MDHLEKEHRDYMLRVINLAKKMDIEIVHSFEEIVKNKRLSNYYISIILKIFPNQNFNDLTNLGFRMFLSEEELEKEFKKIWYLFSGR